MTETLALRKALLLAVDLGYEKVLLETDCLMLKQNVDKGGSEIKEWQCQSIVHEISRLLNSRARFSICLPLGRVIVLLIIL